MGLISLLLINEKPQILLDSMPVLFKNLIKLLKKNCKSRIILFAYENRKSPISIDDPTIKGESSENSEE